jgi:hypothetical protein
MNAEPDMTDKSEEVNKLFERTTDTAVPGASIIIIQDGNVLLKGDTVLLMSKIIHQTQVERFFA